MDIYIQSASISDCHNVYCSPRSLTTQRGSFWSKGDFFLRKEVGMAGDHLNRSNTDQSVYTAQQMDTAKVRDGLFAFERPEFRRGFQCSTVKEYWEVSCKVVFPLQVFFWIVSLSLCLPGLKCTKQDMSFTATEQDALCGTVTTSLCGRVKPG